jgi:hypothetical protein
MDLMTKVTDARAMRGAAFELAVTAAGKTLENELDAAGDNQDARRAAWQRYSAAQAEAGDAYKADMSAAVPERTATTVERAEVAKIERALSGRQLPRTLHALCEQTARLVTCECGTGPSAPCGIRGGRPVYHLSRFATARWEGLRITCAELDTVLDAASCVFTRRTLIHDEEGTR